MDREALATKSGWRRSGDGAKKDEALTWGDLALRLKGRRREAEREVSRGGSSDGEAGRGKNLPATAEDGLTGG
jgi:hypothetical protein